MAPQDGLLTLDRLQTMVPQWKTADIWFCGPAGFGREISEAMVKQGFPASRFHQELFAFR